MTSSDTTRATSTSHQVLAMTDFYYYDYHDLNKHNDNYDVINKQNNNYDVINNQSFVQLEKCSTRSAQIINLSEYIYLYGGGVLALLSILFNALQVGITTAN